MREITYTEAVLEAFREEMRRDAYRVSPVWRVGRAGGSHP